MKFVRSISRFIPGIVFIFSGFVKALDPLGSAYKFSDYFHAFGLNFLDSFSLGFAIFLAAFELVLGIVLILGYQKRITYGILLVFMSFFTVLTFILALTNPVTDCGCFGDALVLTNWQTFLKNLVLMLFVLALFRSRKRVRNIHSNIIERGLIFLFFGVSFLFSITCLHHLPVIDFRPYNVGTYIPAAIEVPEGAPLDEYETTLFYKNLSTGNTEEFTIENYPQDTLQYSFVTSRSKLVKKGYEPPIHDFGVVDPDGMEVTDELLSFSGYSLFFISHELEKVNPEILQQCNDWAQIQRLAEDFKFIPITSSTTSAIEEITAGLDINYRFYAGDEIMLKTMIRSNPGFFLMKNGTIIAKWGWRDFPSIEKWNSKWTDLIQQFIEEQDPEIMMLINEGLMDDLNWNMVDFDRSANAIVAHHIADRVDRMIWALFIVIVGFSLLVLQIISSKKKDWRG